MGELWREVRALFSASARHAAGNIKQKAPLAHTGRAQTAIKYIVNSGRRNTVAMAAYLLLGPVSAANLRRWRRPRKSSS